MSALRKTAPLKAPCQNNIDESLYTAEHPSLNIVPPKTLKVDHLAHYVEVDPFKYTEAGNAIDAEESGEAADDAADAQASRHW